jgi:hypothetical protein
MLFQRQQQEAIADGRVTLTFRRWRRPQARAGGRYRVGAGLIEVTSVELVPLARVTQAEARSAGFDDRAALLRMLGGEADEPVYRIEFRFAGPDDRPRPATDAGLDGSALEDLVRRLEAMDRRSAGGAWTAVTLRAIRDSPATRAADLAARLGRETQPFKADVRKLKRLGLTESLEVGYRLTPRGEAVLAGMRTDGRN